MHFNYLGSNDSDMKKKALCFLFSATLKVGKSKLPLFFGLYAVLFSFYLLNLALMYNGLIPSNKMATSPLV